MPRSAARPLRPFPGADVAESTPAARIADTVAALDGVFALEEVAAKVRQAGVLLRLDCTDRAVQPIFLILDEDPVRVTLDPPGRRPDVVLTLTTESLRAVMCYGVALPLRILSGEIAFQGPVRKFLRVLPVLRAAMTDAATTEGR